MDSPILWDKLQTAKLLGISVRGLDRLIRDAENPLPHLQLGRLIKFRPEDVQRWIDSRVTTEAPRLAEKCKGVMPMSDIPPHDIDAEYATIGSMLLDNDIIPDVLGEVSEKDFYNANNRRMFAEIVNLHQDGQPADMVTLGTRLGPDYLHPITQAAEKVPHAQHASYYAGIVRGMAERRQVIAEAKKRIAEALDVSKALASDKKAKQSGGPVLTCLADVEAKAVSWLWPGRLPMGRIALLVGRPGEGKSFVTTDMAARVTTGTPWPDGSECPKGSVIFISAEDDPADTIRPRLDAHHADVARVHLLSAIRRKGSDGKTRETVFTLADVAELEKALEAVQDCKLIVIDPIGSYLGGGTDAHRDNEVRGVLAPVAQLAERYGPAVLVVAHRRKSSGGTADDTALGSRAFTGIARAVWHLSHDRENPSRRLLLPGKNNLSEKGKGLAFSIVPEPARVCWEKAPVEMSADDALAAENADRRKPGPDAEELKRAETWLREILSDGPVESERIKKEGRGEDFSWRTLKRAKDEIGVKARRQGFGAGGKWVWDPPPEQTTDENNLASYGETETWHSMENQGENALFSINGPKECQDKTTWHPMEDDSPNDGEWGEM